MERTRNKLIRSGRLDASPESSGLDEDDGDCAFEKYATNTKKKSGKKTGRRVLQSLPSYKSLDEFQLSSNELKTKFPNLKQQQKQKSVQVVSNSRKSDRVSKLLASSAGSSFASSCGSSFASSDDEEFLAYRSTLNQDLKVVKLNC